MNVLRRLLAPKEIRALLGVLDEADQKFDCRAFEPFREKIETAVLAKPDKFVAAVRDGNSPRHQVYCMIANMTGRALESGQHHMYRGILNPLGDGPDLLMIHDAAVDELVLIGSVDKCLAEQQKKAVREGMLDVG